MDSVLLLRHALGTVAYRALRALRPTPPGFSDFRAAAGFRSAGEILAHISHLLDWDVRFVNGPRAWIEVPPSAWEADQDRFFAALTRLDHGLKRSGAEELAQPLLRGPVADVLTHVGQISLLRGLAGAPARGENFFVAEIMAGRTTAMQRSAKETF